MKKLLVVSNPRQWDLHPEGVEVVSARRYLTSPVYGRLKNVRVFNLSREYRYQSRGYYVSLLAEARGHKVIPSVKTIQDLKAPTIVRVISEDLDALIQRSLRHIKSSEFVLSIYFGENVARQYYRLAQELYRLFQAPLLRARFGFAKRWSVQSIRAISMNEIPEAHLSFLQDAAARYFGKTRYDASRSSTSAYDLAILVNPDEEVPPSNRKALQLFEAAAESMDCRVHFVTKDDYGRLAEFDALLIRETTAVDDHTYRFARLAQSEGLAVIDDPESILRCANKVYLAEMLHNARIPTPKTLIVHAENRDDVEHVLGLPCVLKLPDSSFSRGVVKVDDATTLQHELQQMLAYSDLVVAQSYVPTPFDWRVGLLDRKPLFACKYFMAKGHWQIYNWDGIARKDIEGAFTTLPLGDVPPGILRTAARAARLVGDGLYGIDLKEIDGKALLIEINDNPNIDAGVEDLVAGPTLYETVIRSLLHRLERKRGIRRG